MYQGWACVPKRTLIVSTLLLAPTLCFHAAGQSKTGAPKPGEPTEPKARKTYADAYAWLAWTDLCEYLWQLTGDSIVLDRDERLRRTLFCWMIPILQLMPFSAGLPFIGTGLMKRSPMKRGRSRLTPTIRSPAQPYQKS